MENPELSMFYKLTKGSLPKVYRVVKMDIRGYP